MPTHYDELDNHDAAKRAGVTGEVHVGDPPDLCLESRAAESGTSDGTRYKTGVPDGFIRDGDPPRLCLDIGTRDRTAVDDLAVEVCEREALIIRSCIRTTDPAGIYLDVFPKGRTAAGDGHQWFFAHDVVGMFVSDSGFTATFNSDELACARREAGPHGTPYDPHVAVRHLLLGAAAVRGWGRWSACTSCGWRERLIAAQALSRSECPRCGGSLTTQRIGPLEPAP